MLAAFLVGLLVPGLCFYIRQLLDVKVRGRRDIEENLTIPFLGEIPRKSKKSGLVVVHEQGARRCFGGVPCHSFQSGLYAEQERRSTDDHVYFI